MTALSGDPLEGGGVFDATHTALNQIGTEVANGNGYTGGGVTLTNVTVSSNGNDAVFTADAAVWTATDNGITASFAVLYNNTDGSEPPLALIDFEGPQTAAAGTQFRINWNANGIFTFTVA